MSDETVYRQLLQQLHACATHEKTAAVNPTDAHLLQKTAADADAFETFMKYAVVNWARAKDIGLKYVLPSTLTAGTTLGVGALGINAVLDSKMDRANELAQERIEEMRRKASKVALGATLAGATLLGLHHYLSKDREQAARAPARRAAPRRASGLTPNMSYASSYRYPKYGSAEEGRIEKLATTAFLETVMQKTAGSDTLRLLNAEHGATLLRELLS